MLVYKHFFFFLIKDFDLVEMRNEKKTSKFMRKKLVILLFFNSVALILHRRYKTSVW